MKLNIKSFILVAVMLLSMAACKKETPASLAGVRTTGLSDPANIDGRVEWADGILTGKVMPVTKYTLELYNESYKREDYSIEPGSGNFIFTEVRAGGYILRIHPLDPTFQDAYRKVRITADEVSDLGIITLEK